MAMSGAGVLAPRCLTNVTLYRHTPEGMGNVEIYPTSLS